MVTVSASIAHYTDAGNTYYNSLYDTYSSFSNTVTVGRYASTLSHYAFYRFAAVNIPQQAVVNSATLTLKRNEYAWSGSSTSVNILAAWNANPSTPTSGPEVREVVRTFSATSWAVPTAVNTVSNIDVTDIVSEVCDLSGWAQGNAILFFIDPSAGSDEARGGLTTTPTLNVDYTSSSQTETGGTSSLVTVSSFGDGLADQRFYVDSVVSGSDVTLSWESQTNAMGYAIERDGEIIAWGVTGTNYIDSPGVGEHVYRVGVIQ